MTPLGKQGTNHFRVWSQAIPTHVAVSVEQVMKVPEEVLRALDSDDFPHVYKRADTLDLVKGHLDGSSGDAVVEILQVSLLCPLSRKRMKVPCRGVHCRHVQCFDAYAYLAANESTMKPFWRCPVCDLALPVEECGSTCSRWTSSAKLKNTATTSGSSPTASGRTWRRARTTTASSSSKTAPSSPSGRHSAMFRNWCSIRTITSR
ncbi:E3 SUMO-protein ligase gei-17-like [Haemaphysalis longicornis]